MEKRISSINTVSHDTPTVSAQFIYGSTTTHDGSATIHPCGARNAHDAPMIRYSASMIQADSNKTSFSYCIRDESGESGWTGMNLGVSDTRFIPNDHEYT